MLVRRLRTIAAQLLVDREQQPDVAHTFSTQTLGSKDLRGDNSLRITRTAPVNKLFILTRRYERRHRVHVRREHHARRLARRRNHVITTRGHLLSLNLVPDLAEITRQILTHRQLITSQRWNVNQLPR